MELADAGLQEALALLGRLVLGVLAQVAVLPRLQDLLGKEDLQLVVELLDLVLEPLLDLDHRFLAPGNRRPALVGRAANPRVILSRSPRDARADSSPSGAAATPWSAACAPSRTRRDGDTCLLEGPRLVAGGPGRGRRASSRPRRRREPSAAPPAGRPLLGPARAPGRPSAGCTRTCWPRSPRRRRARAAGDGRAAAASTRTALFAGTPLVLVAVGVQNPGNLGGLLRTAEAAGATGALLTGGTADPALLEGPAGLHGQRVPAAPSSASRAVAAALQGLQGAWRSTGRHGPPRRHPLRSGRSPRTLALAAGQRGRRTGPGAEAAARPAADHPARPAVESLNVGVAAGILLFEAARQRQTTRGVSPIAWRAGHSRPGLSGLPFRHVRRPPTPRHRSSRKPKPGRPPRAASAPTPPSPTAMRPRALDEILGQDEVLGPGKPLRRALEQDQLRSLILWGPPGSGKTTLAHVIRRLTRAHFEAMSAVLSGVKELREVLKAAEDRRQRSGTARPSSSSTRSTATTRPSRTPCSPTWSRATSCSSAPPPRTHRSR